MGLETQLLGSGIFNFGRCAMLAYPELTRSFDNSLVKKRPRMKYLQTQKRMLTVVSAANFYKWNSGFRLMHHVGAPDLVCLEEMTHLGAYLHQPVRDGFSPLVAVFDKFHFLLCIASSLVVRRTLSVYVFFCLQIFSRG